MHVITSRLISAGYNGFVIIIIVIIPLSVLGINHTIYHLWFWH